MFDICGVEGGQFAGLHQRVGAEREDIGKSAGLHGEVAEGAADTAEGVGRLNDAEHGVAAGLLLSHHTRIGQKLLQPGTHPHRTRAGTAAAMGRGKCFVEVDVHHVETHVAGACHSEHGIEVGTVVIHQRACLMHHAGNFGDVLLEDAESVGVGEHHGGHCVVEQRSEVGGIDRAVSTALHLHHLETADCSRSGIGAVGRVGHDDLAALLTLSARVVVGAYHHQPGQFAVGACVGIEGEFAHSPYFAEAALQHIVDRQSTLACLGGRQRVQPGESAVGGNLLVDFGVILHGA